MTETMISRLTEMGAKRWTKNSHDRLYLNSAAYALIKFDAETKMFDGRKISNSYARDISIAIDKTYIDLNASRIVCPMKNGDVERSLFWALDEMEEGAVNE